MATTVRISRMSADEAIEALDRLHASSLYNSQFDRNDFIRNIKDAFTHPLPDVVAAAIDVCIETNYVYEFESELAALAENSGNEQVVIKAMEAASYCSDLTPFHHSFKAGVGPSSSAGVALAVLGCLESQSSYDHTLEEPYGEMLAKAISHPNIDVFKKAINLADDLYDETIFLGALKTYTTNFSAPARTIRVLELLTSKKDIHKHAAALERAVKSNIPDVALEAMDVISLEANFTEDIHSALAPIVLWGLHQRNAELAEKSASAIALVPNKSKFQNVLIQDAAMFYEPDRVLRAVMAMSGASQIAPFVPGLLDVVRQKKPYYGYKVQEMLGNYTNDDLVERVPFLADVVRAGLAHENLSVVHGFVKLTARMDAVREFSMELRSVTQKWPSSDAGAQAQVLIDKYARKLSKLKVPSGGPIVTARMDFFASATDEEKGRLHSRDLADLMMSKFRNATFGEMALGSAAVFYLPSQKASGRLVEGQKLDVSVPPSQLDILEGHLVGGRSPECLLNRCRDGSYQVSIIEPLPL